MRTVTLGSWAVVPSESARGLAHSTTLRAVGMVWVRECRGDGFATKCPLRSVPDGRRVAQKARGSFQPNPTTFYLATKRAKYRKRPMKTKMTGRNQARLAVKSGRLMDIRFTMSDLRVCGANGCGCFVFANFGCRRKRRRLPQLRDLPPQSKFALVAGGSVRRDWVWRLQFKVLRGTCVRPPDPRSRAYLVRGIGREVGILARWCAFPVKALKRVPSVLAIG